MSIFQNQDYIETWNGSHKLLASSPLPRPTAGPAGHLWTCGPHPGDNLLMEIEPKYIYKAPQSGRFTCSRIRWRGVHSSSAEHQFGWGRDNQGNLIWT